MSQITINGADLYYEEAGSGPALVFIHAGIADCRMWEAQFAAFARDYRVVRYDQRGFGRSAMPAGDDASTALLFLAGRGNLTRDFTASLPADQPAGEWRLTLRPRASQADFETLTLEVDRTSLTFRGLVVVDAQGGTSAFRFTNMRENRGLPDSDFVFSIPRGVEVR